MARTYRKAASQAFTKGEPKVKRLDIRHGTAMVCDCVRWRGTVADVYVMDARHVRFDRRWCDDRPYEIPNVKRKIKRATARAVRRAWRMDDRREANNGD